MGWLHDTSAVREFSIEQLILVLQFSHLPVKGVHALLEAGNLHILGLLTFSLAWLSDEWLLQYIGNAEYGFPPLTFQEYLAARYIADQPDPEYIDLVMAHLH